jgi:hypothetical protein
MRWTQAGIQGLGDLPGGNVSSEAFGVSPDGSVVVGVGRAGLIDEAFRWTSAGMVGLGGESAAQAASTNGAVVVGSRTSTQGTEEAFYWTQAGGMQSLLSVLSAQGADVTGWSSLEVAYDVSSDGTAIVGWGTHTDPDHAPAPHPEAFLARLNGGGPDRDGDGIADSADKCPYNPSANQTDTDGDGRGDACECTDQNGDGRNTVADIVAINRAVFVPALATPLCDGTGEGNCTVNDLVAANVEIFSPGNTSICPRQPVPGP